MLSIYYIDLWSIDHAWESVIMNSQFHRNSSMQPFVQIHYHSLSNQIMQTQKIEMRQNTEKLERAEQNIQNGNDFSVNPFLRKTFAPISILESFRLLYLNT